MAPESLHISLFFLGECEDQLVRLVCDAASNVRAQPFDVWFDRSATFRGRPGNRPFVLIGDLGVEGVRSLRRSLGAALAEERMRRLARREFTPHVTLLYAEREVEENPIEAIRWTVNDFVLVHSLRGHRHLGRWPLQPCLGKDSAYMTTVVTIRKRLMREIQLRDAKASLSSVVDEAMQGKPAVITRHGKRKRWSLAMRNGNGCRTCRHSAVC